MRLRDVSHRCRWSGCLVAVLWGLCLPGWPQEQAPGLPWILFNDPLLQRPAQQGLDPQVNMTLTGYNDCSKLWLGSITFPVAGEVTLEAEVEQGLRLYIGGKCVIDGWTAGGSRKGAMVAVAGRALPLRLEYTHLGGEAFARLYWSWEGHVRELVPPSAFSHTEVVARHAQAISEGKALVEALPEYRPGFIELYRRIVQEAAR